jgi:hypothetical protein
MLCKVHTNISQKHAALIFSLKTYPGYFSVWDQKKVIRCFFLRIRWVRKLCSMLVRNPLNSTMWGSSLIWCDIHESDFLLFWPFLLNFISYIFQIIVIHLPDWLFKYECWCECKFLVWNGNGWQVCVTFSRTFFFLSWVCHLSALK